jgi:phage tail tape-measure protein
MDVRPVVCDRARAWISLRLDSELSEFESTLLGAHLLQCPSCRSFESDTAGFTTALRVAPLERVSRLVDIPRRRQTLRLVSAGTTAAAVAAVLVVLTLSVGGSRSGSVDRLRPFVQPSAATNAESLGLPRPSVPATSAGTIDRARTSSSAAALGRVP